MAVQPIFERPNVIVTGGAGFIGSHLCDELVKKNKVICIDNFSSGDQSNIDHLLQNPNFEFIRQDITEPIDLKQFRELEQFKIEFQGIQEIYHLACPTTPKHFEKNIQATVAANSIGMQNILNLAAEYKSKFLLASSAVVYGPRHDDSSFYKESDKGEVDQLSPRACYDEGKRFAETMTMAYKITHNLDVKIARIFRTYGSRMKLREGRMLPDFVYNAIEGNDLTIFGDKTFSSSFCHVSDMVQGLVKLMESAESGPVNFGSDIEYKLEDVARTVIDLVSSSSEIKYEKSLLFMSPLGLPDISKAKELLTWFPVVRLEDGLQEAIDYFKASKTYIKPGTTSVEIE